MGLASGQAVQPLLAFLVVAAACCAHWSISTRRSPGNDGDGFGQAASAERIETDEASLLHVSAALVKGSNRAGAAAEATALAPKAVATAAAPVLRPEVAKASPGRPDTSPLLPTVSWLQSSHSSRGWVANFFLVVLILFFGFLVFLYCHGRYRSPQASQRRAPSPPSKTPPPPERPRGPAGSSLVTFRQPQSSTASPSLSREGTGGATPMVQSSIRASQAVPSVPPGQKYVMAVPSLMGATQEHDVAFDYQVTDVQGNKLLHIHLLRPHPDLSGGEPMPSEYVTLASPDGKEELAMCAFIKRPGTTSWDCQVYQGESELFGYITNSGKDSFTLTSSAGKTLLRVVGNVIEQNGKVFGPNDREVAAFTPGGFSFTRRGQYAQLECFPDADVGLVVLTFLGAQRLRCNAARG